MDELHTCIIYSAVIEIQCLLRLKLQRPYVHGSRRTIVHSNISVSTVCVAQHNFSNRPVKSDCIVRKKHDSACVKIRNTQTIP